MLILGIDPGIARVGFGVVDSSRAGAAMLACGVIETPADMTLSERLSIIYDDVCSLIDAYKPDALAVEELFFNTNVKTGISVAHGRGVVLLAGQRANVQVYEYTPLQVKQAVVGYGRADKNQVIEMVKRILKLSESPKPDDAADAVAIALCHSRSCASLLFDVDRGNTCSTI